MKKRVEYVRDPAVSARIPFRCMELIDQLVSNAKYASRSDFVRAAIMAYLDTPVEGVSHVIDPIDNMTRRFVRALSRAGLLKEDK